MATRRAPAAACLSTRAKRENSSTLAATNAVTRACSVTKAVSCAPRPRTIGTRSKVTETILNFYSISFSTMKTFVFSAANRRRVGFGRVQTRVIDRYSFVLNGTTPIEKLSSRIRRKGANAQTGFAQNMIFQNIITHSGTGSLRMCT